MSKKEVEFRTSKPVRSRTAQHRERVSGFTLIPSRPVGVNVHWRVEKGRVDREGMGRNKEKSHRLVVGPLKKVGLAKRTPNLSQSLRLGT